MDQSVEFEAFRAHGKLPSPRGVALQIIQLANKDDTTVQQIARLISSDPVLAGRIIKVANLLVHREGRPVASIIDAVTVQGIRSVRQLALSLSLIDNFREGLCSGFDYQRFWTHSACTGIAAQQIVAKMQLGVADEAFLLGLLSQVGRLALASMFPEKYAAVLAQSSGNLIELERAAFGMDHNQITQAMLADWGMPKLFQDIALYLERPESSSFHEGERGWRLLQLFHFSHCLANVCVSPPPERSGQIPGLMLLATRAGIETAAFIELGDQVISGLADWGKLLGIEMPAIPSFKEMIDSISMDSELTSVAPMSGAPAFKLRILLVDDDRTTLMLYKALLEKSGHIVTTASNGREAMEIVRRSTPQLIISDWMMPEMDGIAFCRELRKNPDWHNIYVFIVTSQESTEKLVEAFEAGVNDYLSKPINPRVLSARLRSAQRLIQMQEAQEADRLQLRQLADELALSNKRLQELALTDVLTGLPNRRYGMERLEQGWALAARSGRPVCCMIVDVDHFKRVNDTYGHQAGDEALKMVARTLQQAARKQDVVCRLGGEEFMVICPDSDMKAGYTYAERLRQHVEAQSLQAEGAALHLTVSIGLTDNAQLADTEAMLHEADNRLYAAKAAGRNCTIAGRVGA